MHDDIPHKAYVQLYGKEPDYRMLVKYHARFTGFNANVKKTSTTIEFHLSRKFEGCEPEIQMGVMQFLLNKLFKTKVKSADIDLYHTFVKKLSEYAPVDKNDPALEASFQRMTNRYFNGMMTRPNLVWGNNNVRLLGTYTYATDTIMISSILKDAPEEILDYVVYHEMLHKKHKFNHSSNRTRAHTKAFRHDERSYHVKDAEQQLKMFLRKAGHRKYFTTAVNGTRAKERSFVQRILDMM